MRVLHPGLACVALVALLLGGCASVNVARPVASTDTAVEGAPQRAAHWQFDGTTRAAAASDGYRPPRKLAVLLPMTGSLATAAAPVRDGLLTGYYGESRARPELQFYDTTGTAAGAVAAYQRAISEGADQVLGPLGRDEVDAVFRAGAPNVPVLALNRVDTTPPANAGSFALAPEDEGSGAADYFIARNARQVLVLSAGDDNARRSVGALTARLAQQNGSVVQVLTITGDKPGDQLPALQAVAQRGVDGVFIAMRAPAARAVAPQLSVAGLAGKPRVATSQLLSGTGKVEEDRALDGIAFPTDQWSVGGVGGVRGLPAAGEAGRQLPTARGPAARLFAFGYDAWLVTAYLERLATGRDATLPGATGTLRLDATGNVLRTPAWSSFSGGIVVPLAGSGG